MRRVVASARCRRRAAQSERLFCSAEGRAVGRACGTPLQLGARPRPHCFLLLWTRLPRAARRNARVAPHRFLLDSRALLRGEEAGWRWGGARGRREAAGERGPRTEDWRERNWGRGPALRATGPLPAQASRAVRVWGGRSSESRARERSGS